MEPWFCDCPVCDWDRVAPSEQVGRLVEVLHLLTKHPDDYRHITGNDPEIKAKEYQEYVDHFRRYL